MRLGYRPALLGYDVDTLLSSRIRVFVRLVFVEGSELAAVGVVVVCGGGCGREQHVSGSQQWTVHCVRRVIRKQRELGAGL